MVAKPDGNRNGGNLGFEAELFKHVVLPKDYARPALNQVMLGERIDLISGIAFGEEGSRSKDVLGRVYEYSLGQFARAEGNIRSATR